MFARLFSVGFLFIFFLASVTSEFVVITKNKWRFAFITDFFGIAYMLACLLGWAWALKKIYN